MSRQRLGTGIDVGETDHLSRRQLITILRVRSLRKARRRRLPLRLS